MDNKLSELSKPVAWLAIYHGDVYDEAISITRSVVEAQAERFGWESALTEINPLYSQEYVSALIQRAERIDSMLTESVQALKETEQKSAELEQAMRHIHGALLDITVPRVAIAKAAELAVEHANMKEQSNG
ncbi:hypothetical protein BVG94_02505 [Serratia marcescens]|uniref:hypothetical protein n=1 Tax=Serratia marcescens TaxID=615 RepID=UPI000B5FEBF3|nr:hypothetical protein [Serratia marcescens]ASL91587.1 hypothetical protein BVG94_02505 [Serratia marcescens]